jgi:PKD repeat protein
MMKQNYRKSFLALLISFLCIVHASGQAGKDGAKTVSTAGIYVNDYAILIADESAGATSIQASNNSMGTGFGVALGAGDLIYIIQMQGASITTANDPTYGNISSYNNSGNNEFAEVASVSGANTITVTCGLQHDYSASGRTQILRVPRFSTLTINSGASITCPPWNGTAGGVVAIEVSGNTTIDGSIDVSGRGFRGGVCTDNNTQYGVLDWRWPTDDFGAEKGESIAGSVTDYDGMGGRYCKGAPANGGGGGSGHNAGGGGGGNAGTNAYDGNGCPDVSNASWASAWNLEYAGFASSASSGGGKGGYTFSSSNQNALSVGPFNSAWGGDQRRDNGGRGGRPLDYSNGRIFMGGGGGSGEQNNSKAGKGGAGGGIITILSYGSVGGNGQLAANGENGFNTLTSSGTDGAGGGGGGGCVIVNSTNSAAVVINAKGGNGGTQTLLPFTTEAEGPGGGGGGGYIGLTSGTPSRNANGGTNGTTNSYSLTEFPPNGATKGGNGISNAVLSSFRLMPHVVNICSGTSTTISAQTIGTPPSGIVYSWWSQAVGGTQLGTGSTYTTPVLTSNQTYYVSVCPGVSRVAVDVNVGGGMTANISSTGTCSGSPVSFTGTGTGPITSWLWTFGDNTSPSTQQNPAHTYSTGGTYTVTLTVDDGTCTTSVSQSITITTRPTANFTSSATGTQCGSLPVQFTNTSTNASGYSWNFGDGSSVSTQQNPSHTYSSAGNYTVVLTASSGSCTSTHSLAVSIGNRPLASFSATPAHCVNDPISFNNLSSGNGSPITSTSWNFGDGSPLSNTQNPTHAYAAGGVYNVTLTTNTANCFDDTIIAITINAYPAINFTAAATHGCAPFQAAFSNATTSATSYSWNFGDASSISTQTSPTHIYSAAGSYSVTLIASNNGCADTLSVANMITVANSPVASFNSPTGICLGDSLVLTNNSNGNGSPISSNTWDFGDGSPVSTQVNPSHAYATPGNYNVHLTVSNGGCTDDTIRVINVTPGPVADFVAPVTAGCGTLNASFSNLTTGSATFTWNFGDGSPSSNVSSPSHTYTVSGNYTVTLIATQGSCSDTIIKPNYITVSNAPLSSFTTGNACLGDSIYFTDQSNGNGQPVSSYSWIFDDGGVSTLQSPSHYYASSGTYNVQLTISNGGCSDDTIISVTINQAPTVYFASNIASACDSATVTFLNSSTGATTYSWSFGDGDTSSIANPVHFFAAPGSYTVSLTASNGQCSQTQTRFNQVIIRSTPVVTFTASQTNICKGDCIAYGGPSSVTGWTWDFPGATPASAVSQNPANVCYGGVGVYDVTLTATDGFCTATQTIPDYIHVIDCSVPPQSLFVSSDTDFCSNTCVDFVSLSSNAQSWQWSFPGATPSSSTSEHPSNICYSQNGNYDVTLITGNPAGHDTLVLSSFVHVTQGPGTPVITQAGNTLTATASVSYQWYLNNTAIQGANSQQYTAFLSGDYYVVVADNNGCTAGSAVMHVSLVGIEEFNNDLLFSIYPNPTFGEVNIQIKAERPMKLKLFLTDALGQKFFTKNISANSTDQIISISIADQTNGIYFLHISSEDHQWIRPLVKTQ